MAQWLRSLARGADLTVSVPLTIGEGLVDVLGREPVERLHVRADTGTEPAVLICAHLPPHGIYVNGVHVALRADDALVHPREALKALLRVKQQRKAKTKTAGDPLVSYAESEGEGDASRVGDEVAVSLSVDAVYSAGNAALDALQPSNSPSLSEDDSAAHAVHQRVAGNAVAALVRRTTAGQTALLALLTTALARAQVRAVLHRAETRDVLLLVRRILDSLAAAELPLDLLSGRTDPPWGVKSVRGN